MQLVLLPKVNESLLNNILKNKDQFEQSDLEWLEKQDEQYCHEVKVALFAVEQAPLSLLSFNDFIVRHNL